MGLLDTYAKLQAIRANQESQQMQQLNSVLQVADTIRKLRDMEKEDKFNTAISGVSPYNITERPTGSLLGGGGYDVADPTTMTQLKLPKTDETYYGDIYEATKGIDAKNALPFMSAKRAEAKERETEERRRRENPLLSYQLSTGDDVTASLSNIAPIMKTEESLEEKRLDRKQRADDREAQRDLQRQIAADRTAITRLIAEIRKSDNSPYDKTLVTKTLTEMPKLKKAAMDGQNGLNQIDRALSLVEKGVTGKGGQLKAFLAPYAEMIGIPNDNMNDAQAFQLFARAIIGPMRLDMIGPGPVSEWEQKLMQQLSGGGGAAKPAAIELLSYYKTLGRNKVDNYNQTLEGIVQIAPNIGKVYRSIDIAPKQSLTTPPPPNVAYNVGDSYQGKKIKGINRETRQMNVEGLGVVSY